MQKYKRIVPLLTHTLQLRFYTKTAKRDVSITLSYNKVNMYQTCPKQFKYRYIDHHSQVSNQPSIYGSALHEAIDDFAKISTTSGEPMDMERARQKLQHKIQKLTRKHNKQVENVAKEEQLSESETRKMRIDPEQMMEKSVNDLANFVQREIERGALQPTDQDTVRFPLFSERRFHVTSQSVNMNGDVIEMIGMWDRVDQYITNKGTPDEKSHRILVEYKTKLSPSDRDKYRMQVVIYMYAHKKEFDTLPDLAIVESITTGNTIVYTKEQLQLAVDRLEDFLVKISNAINQKQFDATPSKRICRGCMFQRNCEQGKAILQSMQAD